MNAPAHPAAGPLASRQAGSGGSAGSVRSFLTGARLGWAIAANWTDPILFVIYSVAKPVGASLVLVGMVWIISGNGRPDYMGFLFVGSACWTFVGGGITGLVVSVLEDRERYRMLKYVATSPVAFLPFLLGRATASVVGAVAGCLATLAVGVGLVGVHIDPGRVDWPLLVVIMPLGLGAIAMLGIGLAGWTLTMRREADRYPEAVAGALYLVSGTIFPIDVLPEALRAVAVLLPTTWWIEGMRRALLGAPTPGTLASASDVIVVLALLASTCVLTLAAWGVFRFFDRRARELGLLDQTTGS